jgi:hypothetical protein
MPRTPEIVYTLRTRRALNSMETSKGRGHFVANYAESCCAAAILERAVTDSASSARLNTSNHIHRITNQVEFVEDPCASLGSASRSH